jgi:ABC-type transporter Mla subunit MlaD
MRIPGPATVIGGAAAAAEAVETALGLVPRAADAITRIEALLDRVDVVVERTEAVVDAADQATVRAHATLDTAEVVTREAGRHSDAAGGVLDRVDASLKAWESTLRKLAPQAQRFATSLSTKEVDAAIALVDRLPVVLEHMETDVLPVLRKMERVGPDVHEMLEVIEDLRRVITGLPGVGLLRRRGDDEPPPIPDSVHDAPTTERPRRK